VVRVSPLAVLLALVACGTARPPPAARREGGTAARPGTRPVSSNILRADYAGSDRCASCHGEIYAAWRRSPMHRMTRLPAEGEVRAPFDGRTFHFMEDSAELEMRGGERFVRLSSATAGEHLYRVTRVIGGRYREDFAGIEVSTGATPAGAELLLPVSYVFETHSFRLKGYSVLVGERPGLRAGGVWNQTCVFCHNTIPYFDATWGELYGRGAPSYQGEVVDRLLPRERRVSLEVADPRAFAQALGDEVRRLGGGDANDVIAGAAAGGAEERRPALGAAIRELRARLVPAHFVELGVGCESCHGGSREHADDPHRLPDFAPRAPFLRERAGDGAGEPPLTRAERINRACARCHQVLFSRYPFTWEGGKRRSPDPGGSSITSGEARDFLLGGCARRMACTACHDPHAEDRRETLARLATPAGNTVCAGCHQQYAAPEALRAHAHHDPAGAGGSCIACHMPRKNMGLGYALTRYHRIGSPTDRARVERDRPLECALCHADKSVRALVDTMQAWWGGGGGGDGGRHRYDEAALRDLYGTLDAQPLLATLARGKAHEQAVALAVLGEAHPPEALAPAARQLVNPFPLVRYYAARAVSAIRGAPCDVDLDRPASEIAAAVRRCVPAAAPEASLPAPGRNEPDED
jgi:predicted CXXCH cytochrome family protein